MPRSAWVFTALIGLNLFPSPAFAETLWAYVTESADGKSSFAIDLNSKRDQRIGYDTIRIAWVKVDQSRNSDVPERNSKMLYHFKCETGEMRLMQWADYRADGTVIDSGANSSYQAFRTAIPDTIGSSLLEAACT